MQTEDGRDLDTAIVQLERRAVALLEQRTARDARIRVLREVGLDLCEAAKHAEATGDMTSLRHYVDAFEEVAALNGVG